MKNALNFLVFFFFALFCVRAQDEQAVKGVVTDDTGFPIMGASVVVEGTSVGVSTNMDGEYTIEVPEGGTALEVSYLGMVSQLIAIDGQTTINVQLKEDVSQLDEVVVVAYGTQKKSDVTASVTSIDAEDLNDVTSSDVSTMLQGKASGVQVLQGSGEPGSVPSIRIRGVSSIDGRVNPLWVVDGVIMHGTPNLNPNEIESLSILKDASATSLYGSRGSNGVVVVTTKQAKIGRSELTISSRTGFSQFNQGNFKVMNSRQMYDYYNAFGDTFDREQNAWFNEDLLNKDYDWIGNGTQTGIVQDHNLVFTAGTEVTKTYISLGYFNEKGTVKGNDFDKLSFRLNHDYKVNDKLTLKPKVGLNYSTRDKRQHSMYSMTTYMPWDQPYDDEGNIVNPQDDGVFWLGRDASNYLYDLQWNYSKGEEFNLYTNFDIEYKLSDHLQFISTNGYTLYRYDEKEYTDPRSNSGLADNGKLRQLNSKRITRFTNQMLKYVNSWGDHSLTALVAYEYNDYVYEDFSATGRGMVPGSEILDVTAGPKEVTGQKNEYALQSVLFNSNYAYSDRYLAQLSVRRDGASNFGENNQYGTFYSASAGWNIHNENFFNVDAIDQLKLRASYGAVGNRPRSLYPQYGLYSLKNTYNGIPVATPDQLPNEDVSWEKSYQTNIGVDARLFDRIGISLDYYIKSTSDLLYFVTIPDVTGYSGYWENIGGVRNKGFEAVINADIIRKDDLLWTFDFNIGVNRNEVTELLDNEPIVIAANRKRLNEGDDVSTWYMRKWMGVDPDNGDPLWEVIDKETGERSLTNNWNEATQQNVGSSTPDFYGGFGTMANYKGISLSANFAFTRGNQLYNYNREFYDADGAYPTYNQQVLTNGWNRWEQAGDNATHPKLVHGGNKLSNKLSSRYLEDGSFLRMRNIRLGYELPDKWINSIGLSRLNIYISGDNLWTLTDFSGMDPEVGVDPNSPRKSTADGVYSSLYPVAQRITFGLNASF